MLPKQYLLLSLAEHGSALLEHRNHGGPATLYIRYLNIDGRWAVHGSLHAPLLVWDMSQASSAQAAAQTASKARGRAVQVMTRSDSSWEEGRQIRVFSTSNGAALLGHVAQGEAKARRLRLETEKLEAYCTVVRAATAAEDHAAFAAISRAAATALHAKFGGGSVSASSSWLAGKKGRAALDSVLAGEVELTGPLSIQQVVETVEHAKEAERHRASS
ncbi:hypothetical protein [Variovorax sp. dw_954]|uniref:hypothetical protein n=1 Tax=Variovorax sp. dw_954 TaxID=2720078 RepID=UPI001BD43715|nr:hypothetical protein [Variovorax sp. dw_954]